MSFPSREEDRRMKKLVFGFLAVAVLLAGSVVSSYADGRHGGGWHGGGRHGGGWHGGWHGGWRAPVVFVGPRFVVGSSLYYPRPYVYAPPVVVPPVVVAAPDPPVYTQSPQYWYYCQNPAGYYPAVPQCPTQWLQVAPQPQ
jgi:hypothetical protein